MATVKLTLDPGNPPRFTMEELDRLDAMTDEEITAAAASEPDNPPLTDDELAHIRTVRALRRVRQGTGLSQIQFARRYRIDLGLLRDLEQGRTAPDSALEAYLLVIEHEPEAVARA